MKKLTKIASVVVLGSLLTSCSQLSNQDVGVVTGGVVGGLIGSRFGGGTGQAVAIAGGTLLGAIIGSKIGQTMDQVDQQRANQALENNRVGQTTSWRNPDSGNAYSVEPTRTYSNDGRPCREYVTTANIGGKTEKVYGRACRMSDGSWQAAN